MFPNKKNAGAQSTNVVIGDANYNQFEVFEAQKARNKDPQPITSVRTKEERQNIIKELQKPHWELGQTQNQYSTTSGSSFIPVTSGAQDKASISDEVQANHIKLGLPGEEDSYFYERSYQQYGVESDVPLVKRATKNFQKTNLVLGSGLGEGRYETATSTAFQKIDLNDKRLKHDVRILNPHANDSVVLGDDVHFCEFKSMNQTEMRQFTAEETLQAKASAAISPQKLRRSRIVLGTEYEVDDGFNTMNKKNYPKHDVVAARMKQNMAKKKKKLKFNSYEWTDSMKTTAQLDFVEHDVVEAQQSANAVQAHSSSLSLSNDGNNYFRTSKQEDFPMYDAKAQIKDRKNQKQMREKLNSTNFAIGDHNLGFNGESTTKQQFGSYKVSSNRQENAISTAKLQSSTFALGDGVSTNYQSTTKSLFVPRKIEQQDSEKQKIMQDRIRSSKVVLGDGHTAIFTSEQKNQYKPKRAVLDKAKMDSITLRKNTFTLDTGLSDPSMWKTTKTDSWM
ncbi:hypothetical protein PCE1_001071 [Barthelona sp. PCE]